MARRVHDPLDRDTRSGAMDGAVLVVPFTGQFPTSQFQGAEAIARPFVIARGPDKETEQERVVEHRL